MRSRVLTGFMGMTGLSVHFETMARQTLRRSGLSISRCSSGIRIEYGFAETNGGEKKRRIIKKILVRFASECTVRMRVYPRRTSGHRLRRSKDRQWPWITLQSVNKCDRARLELGSLALEAEVMEQLACFAPIQSTMALMSSWGVRMGRLRYDLSAVCLRWPSWQRIPDVTCHTLLSQPCSTYLLLSSSTNSASTNIRYICLRFPLASVLPPSEPPSVAFLHPIMSSIASQDTSSSISQPSDGGVHEEDWDRSESEIQLEGGLRTPRNSVLFPVDGGSDLSPRKGGGRGNRTLSELLKLYAEKGTDCKFSQEEATRIADVLGQWVCPFLF